MRKIADHITFYNHFYGRNQTKCSCTKKKEFFDRLKKNPKFQVKRSVFEIAKEKLKISRQLNQMQDESNESSTYFTKSFQDFESMNRPSLEAKTHTIL